MPNLDAHYLKSTLNPRYLELILLPTEQCNFRCTYCYEDFEIGQMRFEVQQSVQRLIEKRVKDVDHLNLQWFGGEPLAAKQIVFDISKFAQMLCREHDVGFTGGLTTNGYLLNMETVARLYELDQTSFQISLDGFGAGHDHTRRLASGGGTFRRIWANLEAMRESKLDFSVLLRIHLTLENMPSVSELALRLRGEFLQDKRFSVLLKPVENLGGPNSKMILPMNSGQRDAAVRNLRNLLHPPPSDGPSPAPPPRVPSVCYASRPNSFVIRADGRVQKCTVALAEAHNTVGMLHEDGSVHLDRSRMGQWMRGYSTSSAAELRCPAEHFPQRNERIIPIAAIS